MNQPDKYARAELGEIVSNLPLVVTIPGTKRKVKIRGMHPYTIERLTALWVARDLTRPDTSSGILKELCKDPYFNHKQAALMVLNSWLKIKMFWWFLWRWYAFIRQYREYQLTEIISAGKKKIPLTSYWTNIILTLDMRNDWITMTSKEAEQYQAELISGAKQLLSKNSPNTVNP